MDIRQVSKDHPYDHDTLKVTLDGRDCGDICVEADADRGRVELMHMLPPPKDAKGISPGIPYWLVNSKGAVTSVHHGEVKITGELREAG